MMVCSMPGESASRVPPVGSRRYNLRAF